ncbi:MAG: ABC transporter permease subunit [Kiritimatiellia bacterium]|jgi:microcin C transport system permease protein|nr:ABC transporter permease subunit [Kiritimatiellia bacterium]
MRLLPRNRLSPLTRKRLEHFLRIRRARAALALLTALFAVSLCAEWLCNGRPLVLRVNGRVRLPFLQRLTLRDLAGPGAEATRVNYRAFVRSPAFTTNPLNRVIWAPVPYSPGDVVDAGALSRYRTVHVSVVPEIRVGRFNLLPNGTVIRAEGCEPFFPGEARVNGAALDRHWLVPEALRAALDARAAGRPAPAQRFLLTHLRQPGLRARVTLPETAGAAGPPRLMFRQIEAPDLPVQVRFRRDDAGTAYPVTRRVWRQLPAACQPEILALASAAFAGTAPTARIPWKDRHATVACGLTEVAWPFPPVRGHWMGIDAAGRDVFTRVLYGMRTAMLFGLLLALWAVLFGVVIGAAQGYFGGWVDILGQRLTEIWSALPFLYVMIFIGSALGRSFLLLLLCYGLFNWIGVSYYLRAEFLRLRNRTFVEAARCQGLSSARIIFHHILPNALTPLITLFPFTLIGAIGSLAALDFLGFGLPPLTPSWGELLQQAQQFRWAWWLILFPSLALFTVMLLAVLIGEGLREAFDPRQTAKLE